ncbi:MAG: FRG domain-containing protein [Polyangiaceae bacterium]|nr:FRG domain-containing protein [Polyangiaceae bacterium]
MAKPQPIGEYHFERPVEFLRTLMPGTARWYKKGKSSPRSWYFRGHGDARWELLPSIFRKALPHHDEFDAWRTRTRSDTLRLEVLAIRDFVSEANRVGLHVPGTSNAIRDLDGADEALWKPMDRSVEDGEWWPPDHLLEAFALAQHFGLPTRLLDWSRNPLSAAYFAAHDAITEAANTGPRDGRASTTTTRARPSAPPTHLAVWCLNKPFYARLFGFSKRFALIQTPSASNPRVHAQSGVFTIDRYTGPSSAMRYTPPALDEAIAQAHQTASDPLLRDVRDYSPGLVKICLPIGRAPELLQLLDEHGVTASTLFPGFSSVVQTLYDRVPLVLPSYVPAFRRLLNS